VARIKGRRKQREQKIQAASDRLTQERMLTALRTSAVEAVTARQIAGDVPEAAVALRAIVLAAAQRQARRITER
jgi:hypothetical protein